MSKLNVDQIEANGTNSNVKVVGKGVGGACEIKGATNDGTLQLNCSAQSHGVKLKAPSDSAGQNYTMILPDNQIATNKLLKVKSVTGSGESAVGQLEFADEPNVDVTNLNAENITTGTIPVARFPADIDADKGSVLQLISKTTVGSGGASFIQFSLDASSTYKIIGKDLRLSTNAFLEVSFPGRNLSFSNWSANGSSNFQNTNGYNNSNVTIQHDISGNYESSLFNFTMEVGTVANHVYFRSYGFASDKHYSHNYCVAYSRSSTGLSNIRITPDSGAVFSSGTEVILYKYKSS
tara:strand:+ start:859 stop:1737 length:879 start_codon:yes stop_codon:yes gene_type:complete